MSLPNNQISGHYFLCHGKRSPSAITSKPIPHPSLSEARLTSPLPILFSPLCHPHSPSPLANSDTSTSPWPDFAADYSDSDLDDDMASSCNTLVPTLFTGRQHEDALEFIRNFELCATFCQVK